MNLTVDENTSLKSITEMESVKELHIFIKVKTFNFNVLAKNLKILHIKDQNPVVYLISHPNIEELHIKNLIDPKSLLDIDGCPKLKKFRTATLHYPVKCSRERCLEEFTVEKSWTKFPWIIGYVPPCYLNIKIYSQKQQGWRCEMSTCFQY